MYLFIGCNGHVSAVAPATGQEIWRTKLSGNGLFSAVGHSDVCILEDEGTVYAGCYGHLFALDAATGTIRWKNALQGMGHNDVTLAMKGKSVQYVSTHSSS